MRRGGFTLIELLVVVAIIALLVSILLPSLTQARNSAVSLTCLSNLRQTGQAFGMYLMDHNDVYPCAQDPFEVQDCDNVTTTVWLWMLMNSPADTYSSPVPSIPINQSRVSLPAQKILAGEWASNHYPISDGLGDGGWWCWSGRRNFLFADSHAATVSANQIMPANDFFPDPNLTVNGVQGFDVR